MQGYHDHGSDVGEAKSLARLVVIPLLIVVVLILTATAVFGQTRVSYQIEPNADIVAARGVSEAQLRRVLPDAVRMVREYGFQCDSVSSFRPLLAYDGFLLRCNRFTRQYELRSVDGYWAVIRRR